MAVSATTSTGSTDRSPWTRRSSYLQDALLVCASAVFFYVHATYAIQSRSAASVFFAAEQGVLVGMFLLRRRTDTTSQRPSDWIVAALGGWLPLAMRPHETAGSLETLGVAVQIVGLTCVIYCFSNLGKSFGVVAANRGLKVQGPYRLVRHPIYAAHFITMSGLVLANLWWPNVLLLATVMFFQVLRIGAEERVLGDTSDYASYRARVRWRLVPGLY